MSKSLNEIKEKISQKYLGKSGIHGVGMRRREDAVYLYADADSIAEDVLKIGRAHV